MQKTLFVLLSNCPRNIRDKFEEIRISEGENILCQGDVAEYVYFLIKGRVKVFRMVPNGLNYLEYIYTDYEMFGEIEIINEREILANIKADSFCILKRLKVEYFKKWMSLDREFSEYVIFQLSDKLYEACISSAVNTVYPLKYRILYFIIKHFGNSDKAVEKEEILTAIGGRVRSLNRVISELVEDNFIFYDKGKITVADYDAIVQEMNKFE